MPKVIITNCDSEESPLRDFGILNGEVFDAEVEHMPDGSWNWVVRNWQDDVNLEIMPDECQILGEKVRPIRSHA